MLKGIKSKNIHKFTYHLDSHCFFYMLKITFRLKCFKKPIPWLQQS